jgi:hypothetical protein
MLLTSASIHLHIWIWWSLHRKRLSSLMLMLSHCWVSWMQIGIITGIGAPGYSNCSVSNERGSVFWAYLQFWFLITRTWTSSIIRHNGLSVDTSTEFMGCQCNCRTMSTFSDCFFCLLKWWHHDDALSTCRVILDIVTLQCFIVHTLQIIMDFCHAYKQSAINQLSFIHSITAHKQR